MGLNPGQTMRPASARSGFKVVSVPRPAAPPRASSYPNSGASTSSSKSSGGGEDPTSGQRPRSQQRAAELFALLRETGEIAASNGPRGFARALQGATAVATLARSYLQSGTNPLDAPQVVLRKLFESLGATYIKVRGAGGLCPSCGILAAGEYATLYTLTSSCAPSRPCMPMHPQLGQFIASSPSLFPDAYVLEFQKCLDKTDPVPFNVIKQIIEQVSAGAAYTCAVRRTAHVTRKPSASISHLPQDLGKPWSEVFESIEPQALAAASVAQVGHGGRLLLMRLASRCSPSSKRPPIPLTSSCRFTPLS